MPRRRLHDDISEGQLALIERHIFSLGAALDRVQLSLTPFKPHYDAISDLKKHMREAMNLLMDRTMSACTPRRCPAPSRPKTFKRSWPMTWRSSRSGTPAGRRTHPFPLQLGSASRTETIVCCRISRGMKADYWPAAGVKSG